MSGHLCWLVKTLRSILHNEGVPIKIDNQSGLMHLKITIVDQKVATNESFNYSKAPSTTNDEVIMIIRDEQVALSFTKEFDQMWQDTKRVVDCEKGGIPMLKTFMIIGDPSCAGSDCIYVICREDQLKGFMESCRFGCSECRSYQEVSMMNIDEVSYFVTEKGSVFSRDNWKEQI
ncbi:phospholipase D-like domain-containing protein [Brevibacillus sp. NPDC058079]|uniref:phospholipase D-like domain-containing protein n=1 Tax=Brevibacillus sp. NPDC058079 TaxID=3346330 RepID=UPI0036E66791